MKKILIASLLALALAFTLKSSGLVRFYEDGSVGFFDVPGLGFCIPGQLCDEGDDWKEILRTQ